MSDLIHQFGHTFFVHGRLCYVNSELMINVHNIIIVEALPRGLRLITYTYMV